MHEVKYTDDQSLLFPKTWEIQDDGGLHASYGEVGVWKATPWSYQDEWRYIITIVPCDMKDGSLNLEGMLRKLGALVTDREDVSTVPFYDFAIADQAFDSMKIIASPRMSAGNRVILEALRDRYNPNAELLESCIEL